MCSALSEFFFKSPPATVRLQLLEITHPNFDPFRIVRNHVRGPINVRHEDDIIYEYQHFPLRIEEIGSDNSLDQEIQVTLGDVGQVIPGKIDDIRFANNMRTKPVLKYREYLSNSYSMEAIGTPIWDFDGVDDEVSIGNFLNKTSTDAFSVFAWYSSTASTRCLIGKQTDATSSGWRLLVGSASQDFVMFNASVPNRLAVNANPVPPQDGNLHFYGITKTTSAAAAGVTFYVDGSATGKTVTEDTLSGSTTNAATLKLGRRGVSLSHDGQLAHVSVWNRNLTGSEVSQLYNGGTPPNLLGLSFAADLEGWWKLDENDTTGSGGINDYSTGNHDGTANNGLDKTFSGPPAQVYVDPVRGPFTLQINSIAFTKQGSTFIAKPPAFNRVRTGEYYTVERFPMLRGFL